MNEVKLTVEELGLINELYVSINDNGKLGNDIKMLLYNGVKALENNLFYASISVFTVFLEKYLRDTLIWLEYKKISRDGNESGFMKYLEEVEEYIEDEKDDDKKSYLFSKICDKLVEYGKIEGNVSEELKSIYENIRIPVQHGIYARIIKKEIGNYSVPITEIKIDDNSTGEDIIQMMHDMMTTPHNNTIGIHNPLLRYIILPEFFKHQSLILLQYLNNLVKIIEKE